MEKQERKAVEAVQMELSDMIEKLKALHEYLTDVLNLERRTNVESPNNTVSAGK